MPLHATTTILNHRDFDGHVLEVMGHSTNDPLSKPCNGAFRTLMPTRHLRFSHSLSFGSIRRRTQIGGRQPLSQQLRRPGFAPASL